MGHADGWFICRVGYLETTRAVGLAGSPSAVRAVQREWAAFGVIEVDQDLVEQGGRARASTSCEVSMRCISRRRSSFLVKI